MILNQAATNFFYWGFLHLQREDFKTAIRYFYVTAVLLAMKEISNG